MKYYLSFFEGENIFVPSKCHNNVKKAFLKKLEQRYRKYQETKKMHFLKIEDERRLNMDRYFYEFYESHGCGEYEDGELEFYTHFSHEEIKRELSAMFRGKAVKENDKFYIYHIIKECFERLATEGKGFLITGECISVTGLKDEESYNLTDFSLEDICCEKDFQSIKQAITERKKVEEEKEKRKAEEQLLKKIEIDKAIMKRLMFQYPQEAFATIAEIK